ncbi:hypothetical protein [Prevotella sp. P5-64]|uniref:hypothetical protein n=1 Tax=Prevotella sp. P5-64 TaxID=2024226 RepID=UPI000BD79A52|nr:hypothetical protein [Prevotella sp. P5-64]OYP68245.1 hypothetical protein CIK87_08375 [Prevotella sp. P5-64]
MMTEKTHTVTTYFVPARTDGMAEGRLAERATMAMGSVSGTKCREMTMAVIAWWEIVDAWLYSMISEPDFYISQFATSL